MGNPILEQIDKIGSTVDEYQKTNDERIAAVEKGLDGRAKELEQKLEKMDGVIDAAQAKIKAMEAEKAKDIARIEMLEALAERPTKSPEEKAREDYKSTFFTALRNQFGNPDLNTKLKHLEEKVQKDVTIGTTSAGGYALPKEIGDQVDALLLKLSPIAEFVRNIQVGTSDYQELVSIHGGTSAWVSETGSRSATGTPTLRNRKPTWGELYAYPQISEWALQDMQFNAEAWLVNDVAEGMANNVSAAIWNGNGTNKPTGFTNTAPASSDDYSSPLRTESAFQYIPVTSSPQAIGTDNIIDLVYKLNPRYRANARFAMNTVTQGFVRKLKDSNGQYLWQPSLQAGQPDRLLGYELFTWEDMANPTTADGFSVAFGDFRKAYLLVRRMELRTNQDNISTPGYVKFYVRRRWGGTVLNNDAVKLLKLADA